MNLTSEEKAIISQLEANDTKSFDQLLNSTFHANYTNYLTAIGNNEEVASRTSSIIKNFAERYMQLSPESEDVLIFGEATTPEALNSPIDWHIDKIDQVSDIIKYRVSIALKGPSTLFCKLAEGEQKKLESLTLIDEIFDNINNIEDEISSAYYLASAPNPCTIENGRTIYAAPQYFGAIFVTGKTNFSAVHSAPIINDNRIFISFT